ncbi:MAG: peptidoglycan DD-metalloendopeptidase family protein [Bacteroidales bacterium]|nr:peptidoglycan DD-metalloendopeptidase family protein [Bacteroidales bacterium]
MKKINMCLTVALAAVFVFFAPSCSGSKDMETVVEEVHAEDTIDTTLGFCPESFRMVEGKVRSGQFFSSLLGGLGMSQQEAYNLTLACDSVFDVKTLRIGNAYRAYYDDADTLSDGGRLRYLVYERDRASSVVFSCEPPYDAWVYEKPVTVERRYADVTINSSLWNDMRDAGVSPLLILSLSDIYAWTIDFFGLQKGDRFRVLYDERMCDGEVLAVDTVRYAIFSNGGSDLPMIMFDQKDGGNIWWNDKGESMRKAFLKAPLQYSRVSSGFSYARKHPVTRKVQPHTGIDYAAPAGTPVMTIGDGVVTSVKYEGAGGNTVRIRHNSVYSTAYLHLSKYAKGLKAGQRVRQGEVIGYVGSTGRSTGPHLDFRVWKNGTPINPLKMDSPPAEPLKEENMKAFNETAEKYRAQIDSIQARKVAAELFELL